MKIHKEGYATIIIAFLILSTLAVLFHVLLPGFLFVKIAADAVLSVLFLLVVYFFRSPKRDMALSHEYLLSPADGKVVVIEEVVEKEYFKEKRLQVSIFMSPLNVHLNRYPCEGKVKYYRYHPGSYIVAWHPKSSEENERTTVVMENNKNQEILIRQIAGAVARRIVCKAVEGKYVKQGEELGFIKFGSRVDIILPLNADVKVKIGQNVKGGKSVIAEL